MAFKILDRITINEGALFVNVSVKVQTKFNVVVLDHFEQKFLDGINLGLFELVGICIASIEVLSSGVSSEIAFVDTVRVYDRNYVKDKFLQKHLGLL